MTLDQKLSSLADPAAGFMKRIGIAENALAGLSFASGWVTSPPPPPGSALAELPPMPVSGTGTSKLLALRTLMLEAVERNSSSYFGLEKLTLGTPADASVVPLDQLLLLSQLQRRRSNWESLNFQTKIRLAPATSISNGERRLIPAACVYLGYRAPAEPHYAPAESNGCAAGVDMDDATCRGLLEVIERDALAIWWFNRLQRPGIKVDDDDPLLLAITAALRTEKRSLTLVDLTHDVGIPVVAALTADAKGGRIYLGCAADICQRRAAQRAACEMLQFWFWGRVSADPPERLDWLRNESLETQPWLQPSELRPIASDLAESPSQSVPRIAVLLAKCDIHPLLVNLTRPWFQIPVVKVIAPGMRSLAAQFGPGRLFDVPVKLGWRAKAQAEEDLLPYSCPL